MTETLLIPVEQILPNPRQPRTHFDQEELRSLSQSIIENGLINPITVEGPHVRQVPLKSKVNKAGGKTYKPQAEVDGLPVYYLIAGERRLRATKMAGLPAIQCIVKPAMKESDETTESRSVLALVENLQRADLGPVDEAMAYKKIKDETRLSINSLALKLGLHAHRIQERLSLLELDQPIQEAINSGRLPKEKMFMKSLLEIPDSKIRIALAATLANRHSTAKAGIEACRRVMEHLNSEKIPANETPAKRLYEKRYGEVNRPMYDVMAAAGKVPPWPLVELGARKVCDKCELRDSASETTCRGCTLVEFLVEIVGKVNRG